MAKVQSYWPILLAALPAIHPAVLVAAAVSVKAGAQLLLELLVVADVDAGLAAALEIELFADDLDSAVGEFETRSADGLGAVDR